jgi:hypothetical protein
MDVYACIVSHTNRGVIIITIGIILPTTKPVAKGAIRSIVLNVVLITYDEAILKMGLLNWAASKGYGRPSAKQSCDGAVARYLSFHGIHAETLGSVAGERSWGNPHLNVRVYFGTGDRGGKHIGFILKSDENLPLVSGGAVVSGFATWVPNLYRQWLTEDTGMDLHDFVRIHLDPRCERENLPIGTDELNAGAGAGAAPNL